MNIFLIIFIILQIIVDIWCIFGVLTNTKTLDTVLNIIDLVKEQLELKINNK